MKELRNLHSAVRFLAMTNKAGETIDLTKPENFAYAPTGLGITIESDYYAADGYFKTLNKSVAMESPTFTMIFGASTDGDPWKHRPYLAYRNFVNFLNVGGLKLLYFPQQGGGDIRNAHTTDVELVSLTKTEITVDGILEETLTLNRVSPWYKDKSILLGEREHLFGAGKYISSGVDGGEAGYSYGYQYGTDSNVPTIPEAEFEISNAMFNDQKFGVGLIIEMEARADGYQNPTIELTHIDELGREISQRDGYNVTLNTGDRIIISSQVGNNYAYLIRNGSQVSENIYNEQNLDYSGFIRGFNGMNKARTIAGDNNEQDLKVMLRYRDELAVV